MVVLTHGNNKLKTLKTEVVKMNKLDEARNRFSHMSDMQLFDIIDEIAKTITVRTYNEHGSSDDSRESSKEEYLIIRNIAYSAIRTLSFDYKSDVNSIVEMAENTLITFMNGLPQFSDWGVAHCNSYDTIYKPLLRLFGVWG